MDAQFFMVWNPNGGLPKTKHASYDYALREAKRLAHLNPGQQFFVLRATTSVTVRKVEVKELSTPVMPVAQTPLRTGPFFDGGRTEKVQYAGEYPPSQNRDVFR